MSREFKFRLWSKSEKCFVNPNILEVWDESGKMTPFQFIKTGKLDPIYMPIENYVIQQYTGLNDKNNKPIYEGDILARQNTIYFYKVEYCEKEAAYICRDLDSGFVYLSDFTYEVVGNIFELPCKFDHNLECLVCDGWPSSCPVVAFDNSK